MKPEWRAFVENLGVPVEFLHRDEFRAHHGLELIPLPAIFDKTQGGAVVVWMSAEEVESLQSLQDLQAAIWARLHGSTPHHELAEETNLPATDGTPGQGISLNGNRRVRHPSQSPSSGSAWPD